jgi:hypothetical protein
MATLLTTRVFFRGNFSPFFHAEKMQISTHTYDFCEKKMGPNSPDFNFFQQKPCQVLATGS